ncbi:Uncharacterised protein [Helicobacter fennelliae]|nr:Uncharacterised protein [Helicobacter fennelliae]
MKTFLKFFILIVLTILTIHYHYILTFIPFLFLVGLLFLFSLVYGCISFYDSVCGVSIESLKRI